MIERSPFEPDRDHELGDLLREVTTGPDSERFRSRLQGTLAGLPARSSSWDVLAGWARPSVLVAAAAAGFLLGVALWQGWRERLDRIADTSVAVTMLEPSRPGADPIIYAVLEAPR